jgi:hypothetical protein
MTICFHADVLYGGFPKYESLTFVVACVMWLL